MHKGQYATNPNTVIPTKTRPNSTKNAVEEWADKHIRPSI